MTASENKKNKRRKNKKGSKSTNPSDQPVQQPEVSSTKQEMDDIQTMMDADDDDMQLPSHIRGPRCLLCRKQKPTCPDENDIDGDISSVPSSLPLWVCADCRKKVEEDERRKTEQEADERKAAELFFQPEFQTRTSEPTTPNGSICTCQACTERRHIEGEHEQETKELQQCWIRLRDIVRCIYRESVTSGSGSGSYSDGDEQQVEVKDVSKVKSMVSRLCSRDPHQLYQRLESQAREYVIEMKVRLLKQLTSGHKTPPQARQFVTMLLEEYSNMCVSAKKVAAFFNQLESEHLNKFKLTWAKHNKHLFQSIIYTDPLVQNSLPMLITQLRLGAASKEAYHEDSYPTLLHRYLKFDDDMSEISVAWRDCQQLLEEYSEEQAALKAKQKMLKEDWEFFKAQRKLLEKQILKNTKKPSPVNSQCLETQFTETMRNLLQGSKVTKDDYPEHVQCPNCNRKRCPCDECTISHMITCGIISPEVQESMSPHVPTSTDMPSFGHDTAARYVIDITPPSMSSTGSSSGSSSPVPLDTEKLSLPFEEIDNEEAFLQQIKNDLISQRVKEEAAKYTSEPTQSTCCAASGSGDGVMDKCSCSNCQSQSMLTKVVQTEEVPCQCHNCQKGMTMPYLPPSVSVSPPPRPASLHLYPHIHGPNTSLHSALVPHPMPRLHPQLYELHHNPAPAPVRPKPLPHPTKKPFNLDLDSHEALHEHIYHAYGEWENPIENPLLFSAHKFAAASSNMNNGSELLGSPPPLLSGKSFFSDSAGIPPLPKGVSQATKVAANFNLKPINRNLYPTSSQPAKSLVGSSSLPDQCSKHGSSQLNSFANMHAHTSVSASSASTASLTAKLTPDLLRAATNNKDASSLLGSGALGSLAGLNLTQACSHFNQHQLQQPPTVPPVSQAVHKLTPPSLSHTLSAAASTTNGLPSCHDDDCDGNQDDICDDDSCSEQSSSTSTSNQKDGKYCDCCYCEFFGHGTPPVAPTSRNFVEMRDKLRLQLKRKKEIKSPASSTASDTISSAPMMSEVTESLRDEDPVWRMGLDELVRFINGEDEKKSAKTAKKARQKQKKALEKARKMEEEEEQQRRAEEAMKKRAEEEALRLQQMQLQQLQLQQQQQKQQESDSRNNKKRKGKQKESSSQSLDVRNGDSSTCAKGQQSTVNRSGTSSPVVHKKVSESPLRNNLHHHQQQPNEQSKVSRAVSQPRQVSPRVSNQESSAQEQGRKKKTGSGKTPEDEVTSQNAKNTNLKNLCIAKSMAPENGRRIETLPPESGKKKKVNSQPLDKTKLDNTGSQIERVKNVNSTSGSQQNGKLRAEPRQDSPGSRQVQANNKGRVECDMSLQTPVKSTSAMVTMSENKENGVSPKSTDSSPQSGDGAGVPTPNKSRRKKRGKASEDIDEIFLPKQDLDLENGEMDAFEKELEEFKRFCFDSQSTQQRIKLPINLNVKDMRLKKKVPTSVGCG